MSDDSYLLNGLSDDQALENLKRFGYNSLVSHKPRSIFDIAFDTIKEPMFLLLIFTAFIYFFISHQLIDGFIMSLSIILMMVIEISQEFKTNKSLDALKNLSAPKATVRRSGNLKLIDSSLIVPEDLLIISEGDKIPADGLILKQNDLAIDESILTGESEIVYKSCQEDNLNHFKKNYVYQGTNVILGSAEVKVTHTGNHTQTGKIGLSLTNDAPKRSPLEKQVRNLVKFVSIFALVILVFVVAITFWNFHDLYLAIINGISFAISTIPEEFPVILTIFLSLGAYRLSKKNSLIRKLSSVETLGSVSVLCVDKTGTLTLNKMDIANSIPFESVSLDSLLETATLACEKNSYDPMEKAIINHSNTNLDSLNSDNLIFEYPFTSKTKMMGHVWCYEDNNAKFVVAVKGAPESVMNICKLTDKQRDTIVQQYTSIAQKGQRVIAVAKASFMEKDQIPKDILDLKLDFLGLITFFDPSRNGIKESIETCKNAGVRVVMITGDNPITAKAIGEQVGLISNGKILTGEQVDRMSDNDLMEAVKHTNIFARVIPEQKMKIVKAIKDSGLVVAMTGDGVNDAPALKYADIGIAMGKRGTNVAKEASDMILLDDNFSTIVETIKDGRCIYDNIKKAIFYVLTFKIPIIFLTLIIPWLGLAPMLLPIHIVLLELIVDPISAIVLERQPIEDDIMKRKPRNIKAKLISFSSGLRIFCQGFVVFLASFFAYSYFLNFYQNLPLARSIALSILVFSNLFLIYIISSDSKPISYVFSAYIKDKVSSIIIFFIITLLLLLIYCPPLASIFGLAPLSLFQLIIVFLISFISVIWFQPIKSIFNFI